MANFVNPFDVKALFPDPPQTDALLKRIVGELIDVRGLDQDLESDLFEITKKLVVNGDLKLLTPAGEPATTRFQPDFVDALELAVKTALLASGNPHLLGLVSLVEPAAIFSTNAIKWLKKRRNNCGSLIPERGRPPVGPPIDKSDSIPIMRYFVDEVEENGRMVPDLPPIDGSRKRARHLLGVAFDNWENKLNMTTERTGVIADANLVVSSQSLTSAPPEVLALTDIGPPGGFDGGTARQLRMIFDSDDEFSERQFLITAAHEFGHSIGIRHADVGNATGQLMHDTIGNISTPRELDLSAAERKGWRRR